MRQRAVAQRQLFEDNKPIHSPQLQEGVRQEVARLLVQWMMVLAKTIGRGMGDEQDQR
jgi:hypothetical protein